MLALAREQTEPAIKRLIEWMHSDDTRASPMAAMALLDRGWGKPTQPTEVSGKDGGPIQIEDARTPLADLIAAAAKKAAGDAK